MTATWIQFWRRRATLAPLMLVLIVAGSCRSDIPEQATVELEPRFGHAVNYLAMANREASLLKLERDAARLQSEVLGDMRVSLDAKGGAALSPRRARAWAEKERQLDRALADARVDAMRDLTHDKFPTAMAALSATCLDAATKLRRATGPLHSEIALLQPVPACAGDLIADGLLPKFCRAVVADDVPAARRVTAAIQRQMACMSTRQLVSLERGFINAIESAEQSLLDGIRNNRHASAVRDRFRESMAPLAFMLADTTRHLDDAHRARRWLGNHRAALIARVNDTRSIARRLGLSIHDRYSGRIVHITGDCAPGVDADQSACNPLAAYYAGIDLLCDAAHWIPSGRANDPRAMMCDPDCAGLPTAAPIRDNLAGIGLPDGLPDRGDGCGLAGGRGGNDAGGAGGFAGAGAFGEQQCSPGLVTGSFGEQNPAQAYNAALDQCLLDMAQTAHDLPVVPSAGFRPSGGPECFIADGGADTDPDDVPTQNDNLAVAKEAVKALLGAVAEVVNTIAGEEIITQEGLDAAEEVIDAADFGDVPDDCAGGPCEGVTSADGTQITLRASVCDNQADCTIALLHESLHSALSLSSGTTADEDHALIGEQTGDVTLLLQLAMARDCAEDSPSCGAGCTDFDAAAPSCTESALDAYTEALREMEQDADSCATDACWNPMNEDFGDDDACAPGIDCPGQMIALCPEDNPDCMCHDRGTEPTDAELSRLRAGVWQAYCTRAYDERCDSPLPPEGFLVPGGGPPPPPGVSQSGRTGLMVVGSNVVIGYSGAVYLAPEPGQGDSLPVP